MCLAEEGVRVAIAARGQSTLEEAARSIRRKTGSRVLTLQADVAVLEDIEALVGAVLAEFGAIDILVNNAGGPRPGRFTDMSDQDWLGAIELNLMSAIRLTRLVLPAMRKRKWGRIVNITSFAEKQPIPTLILSNTARSGVVAMA
jgi:3-oxoacyl-[acyl-carrier protein] reductase